MAEANMKLLGDEIRRFREQAHPQRISLFWLYELFYLAYPESMKCQLLPEDYARFVKCWNEVEVGMDDVFPVHPHIKMHLGTDEIRFVIHMVELLHVDRLLYVGYYEPKDDGAAIGNAVRPTSPTIALARKRAFERGITMMTGLHR